MKQSSLFVLFCTDEIHRTGMLRTGMLHIVFLVSLESSLSRRGASAWFHGIWTCGVEAQWKLNEILVENFGGIGMCLWCCWKDLDEQDFNGIYLVRFGFRMWEIILIFKWFLLLKIHINSKKPGFGRKNQLKTW